MGLLPLIPCLLQSYIGPIQVYCLDKIDSLPVNITNINSFDSFKAHQKKAMKENAQNFIDMLYCACILERVLYLFSLVLCVLFVKCNVPYTLHWNYIRSHIITNIRNREEAV